MKWVIKTIDCPEQNKKFLHVFRAGKLITTFHEHQASEANDYVQRAIEDENHPNY